MRSYNIFLSIVSVAIFVVSVSVVYASHAWGDYHWGRTANPFTLELGDNVSSAWDNHLATAASDWSVSTVLDATVVTGGTNARKCKPTQGRGEVCSASYGFNGWLGIAQIWVSGDHITQGLVKMNDSYFNTSTYNTPAWRNLVMCQEVGHILGLGHTDEDFTNLPQGTCMDYSSDPVPNQHPNQHDYDQLESIYAHLDSVNTVGPLPPSPPSGGGKGGGKGGKRGDVNLDDPSEWGRSVRTDAKGKHSLYKKDLGKGNTMFTFVIWAE